MANRAIDYGMHLAGEPHHCERYGRNKKLKQCTNCFGYGHIGLQCKAPKPCSTCAGTCVDKCPVAGKSPFKCCVCQDGHHVKSENCPERKKARALPPGRFHDKNEDRPSKPPVQLIGPLVRHAQTTLPSAAVEKEKEASEAEDTTPNECTTLTVFQPPIQPPTPETAAASTDEHADKPQKHTTASLVDMMMMMRAELAEAEAAKPASAPRKRKADGPVISSSSEAPPAKKPRKRAATTTLPFGSLQQPPKSDASQQTPRSTMPQSSAPSTQTPEVVFVDAEALRRAGMPRVLTQMQSVDPRNVSAPPTMEAVALCNSSDAPCDEVSDTDVSVSAPEHSSEHTTNTSSSSSEEDSESSSQSDSSREPPIHNAPSSISMNEAPAPSAHSSSATAAQRTVLGDITNKHVANLNSSTPNIFPVTPSPCPGCRARQRQRTIEQWDIIAIQEPWKNPFQDTTHHPANDRFTLLYPDPGEVEGETRVCFFLNGRIDKSQLSYEFTSRDIGTITIQSKHPIAGTVAINVHNIYNEPATNPTPALAELTEILSKGRGQQHIIRRDDLCHDSSHLPVETTINIELEAAPIQERWVWKSTDKELLLSTLKNALPTTMAPGIECLEAFTDHFTRALKTAVAISTQKKKINPNFSHRGFNDARRDAIADCRKARRNISMIKK
ncbi:MAG: hypothetical protein Q9180_004667, partial [Flavoplaca navasiana]